MNGWKMYFAYGANTDMDMMAMRCPAARPIGTVVLHDHRLVFRGVADVVPADGRQVVGAVWWITPACEAALDRFEGYPRLYVKKTVQFTLDGVRHDCMLYVMRQQRGEALPYGDYVATLKRGYNDFRIPQQQILTAIQEARQYDQSGLLKGRHGEKRTHAQGGSRYDGRRPRHGEQLAGAGGQEQP